MLVDEGQRNNFEIAAAVSRVQQAEAQARIAGAPLLPDVDVRESGSVLCARHFAIYIHGCVSCGKSTGAGVHSMLIQRSL
jgi:hypothetical protein